MTATMLTKEYGYKSPWIGIGSYTVTTATGVMRMANNKHWLSDVLTGAGVGILSTEIGYCIADMIFKNKGINRDTAIPKPDKMETPSFLSLYVGMNVPLNQYDIAENNTFRTSSGSSVGVEGACLGSGVSCSFNVNSDYCMRFFMDYNLQPSHNRDSKEWMNTLTCGMSFAILP